MLALEFLEKTGREYPDQLGNHLLYAYVLEEDDRSPRPMVILRKMDKVVSCGQWGDFAHRWREEIDKFREELDN